MTFPFYILSGMNRRALPFLFVVQNRESSCDAICLDSNNTLRVSEKSRINSCDNYCRVMKVNSYTMIKSTISMSVIREIPIR